VTCAVELAAFDQPDDTYEVIELVPGERFVQRALEGPFPMETTYTWEGRPGLARPDSPRSYAVSVAAQQSDVRARRLVQSAAQKRLLPHPYLSTRGQSGAATGAPCRSG
jgi:hypothetical protein